MGLFQIFKTSVTISAQNPENKKTAVKSQIEEVGKGITTLTTDKKQKLKTIIQQVNNLAPEYPSLEPSLLERQSEIVSEHRWSEKMRSRATNALLSYDKKSSSLFPMKRDRSHFHLPPNKRKALTSPKYETLELVNKYRKFFT